MAYLLPAGTQARTVNKWGLGRYRTMGAMAARAMSNGGGTSQMIRLLPRTPVLPGPPAVWTGGDPIVVPTPGGGGGSVGIRPIQQCYPGDVAMANATWDPVGCRWVPNTPILPPPVPLPPVPAPNAGTPVPAGYPTNQFFVAPDGSVWEYSQSAGSWFNTGTPYSTGATPSNPSTPTAGINTASGAPSPVNVTVTPAPVSSGYQAILDWLTQSTLVSPVPNWIVAAGVGFVGWKMFGSGKK